MNLIFTFPYVGSPVTSGPSRPPAVVNPEELVFHVPVWGNPGHVGAEPAHRVAGGPGQPVPDLVEIPSGRAGHHPGRVVIDHHVAVHVGPPHVLDAGLVEEARGLDEAAQGAGGVGATREAEHVDVGARCEVVAEEVIRVADVVGKPGSDSAAEQAGETVGAGAPVRRGGGGRTRRCRRPRRRIGRPRSLRLRVLRTSSPLPRGWPPPASPGPRAGSGTSGRRSSRAPEGFWFPPSN